MQLDQLMSMANGGAAATTAAAPAPAPAPSPTASTPPAAGPSQSADKMVLPHAIGGGAAILIYGGVALAFGYWAQKAGA